MYPAAVPEISQMEHFITITKDSKPLTIAAKTSILDMCGNPGHAQGATNHISFKYDIVHGVSK